LDKDAAIVAVCGPRKKTFEKTDKLHPPRETEKPLLDEWILADFALFHHLLRQHPGPQDWLTDIDLNLYCETRGPLLHGPPSQTDRNIVHLAASEAFYTVTRTRKLCRTFRQCLNQALAKSARVVVIICAHGFEKQGGYVVLGREKFYSSQLEMLVPSRLAGGAVTLLSTACHSGLFVSPKWTTFCAVPSHQESLSFSRSSSCRNRGGAWAGAFATTIYTHGESLAEDFGEALQSATVNIKASHAPPVHQVAEEDKLSNALSLVAAEDLPAVDMPPQPPRDTGDGELTAGSPESEDKFNALVSSYLSSKYPNPDAPSNHFIHYLIAVYKAGRATAYERNALANAIRQRQADDTAAMAIVGGLGIIPEVPIRDWAEDPDLALQPLYNILRPLIHIYQGFEYRKPMLFVVWVCLQEGVSPGALQRSLAEHEKGKARRKKKGGKR
jgi:hypothetical protein